MHGQCGVLLSRPQGLEMRAPPRPLTMLWLLLGAQAKIISKSPLLAPLPHDLHSASHSQCLWDLNTFQHAHCYLSASPLQASFSWTIAVAPPPGPPLLPSSSVFPQQGRPTYESVHIPCVWSSSQFPVKASCPPLFTNSAPNTPDGPPLIPPSCWECPSPRKTMIHSLSSFRSLFNRCLSWEVLTGHSV